MYHDVGIQHDQSRAENLFLCVSIQAQARSNAACHKESGLQWTYWRGLLSFSNHTKNSIPVVLG